MARVALFQHEDCHRHDMGDGHPEQPARLRAVENGLHQWDLWRRLEPRTAPLAEVEALARAHAHDHVEWLLANAPAQGLAMIDPDTLMNPFSLTAARRASGAAMAAVDGVIGGEFEAAFCATRPPGHHAERATAMGFCFFNHIAVAALHALERHGLERVAICDFDVHHGNGTEDIFDGDPRVLFCSTFQHPFYPGKAGPSVPGQRVNSPLPAGTDGARLRAAIETEWLPALQAFAPELMLISAGFDAHAADPLGGMRLVEEDFAAITRLLVQAADGSGAAGRVVAQLEGGYHLDALGNSAAAHVEVLLDG